MPGEATEPFPALPPPVPVPGHDGPPVLQPQAGPLRLGELARGPGPDATPVPGRAGGQPEAHGRQHENRLGGAYHAALLGCTARRQGGTRAPPLTGVVMYCFGTPGMEARCPRGHVYVM
jgi:hypothetical protein